MERNWTPGRIPRLDGRLAVVTGANSGIGYCTALELARAGAHVVLGCRHEGRGIAARHRLLTEVPRANVWLQDLDLASLTSIRHFTERMRDAGKPVDILVNNAGVMNIPTRELTEDGFERQFGTNHLGHFALTARLLPLLDRASAPRVVTVSSGLAAGGRIDFGDLQSEKKYCPQRAYATSKLANLLFMLELHRRVPALTSVAAHPGLSSTELLDGGLQRWLLSFAPPPNFGAHPVLYAAVGSDVAGGDYLGPRNWMPLNMLGIGRPPAKVALPSRARDEALARELWVHSENLTGVAFDVRRSAA